MRLDADAKEMELSGGTGGGATLSRK